ncbi:hypothetical protein E2C01_073605 [Portunus trituberculatus]|uniref:Uncharacterized protein n=1 Tax=Portunus trituberculatus TaxID=210409 RepID=A0A5B7I5S0_PORTR|nr:hypothetical protein [Portunus trituberculatus]
MAWSLQHDRTARADTFPLISSPPGGDSGVPGNCYVAPFGRRSGKGEVEAKVRVE